MQISSNIAVKDANASTRLSEAALRRLVQAETAGLRLAIVCRTIATGVALVWYSGSAVVFEDFELRAASVTALLFFTALGVCHLSVIGTRFDRWWLKYIVYTLDVIGICAVFALLPVSRSDDVPQIVAFRAYGIYYLFPIVAMACLTLSWRLVIWVGAMVVAGWWGAFLWVVSSMETVYSWNNIPANATRRDYEDIFLSIDFIGRGNRVEETGLLLAAALILSLAVFRARQVFFAQIEAEMQQTAERKARERVTDMLGRYIPEEVARTLIADPSPLRPRTSYGTALVLDIAGFTQFAATKEPDQVIKTLDSFLAEVSEIASDRQGVVISFTGDGLLATFNTPIQIAQPERAAAKAALKMLAAARHHNFSIRIGIASGDIVSGNVGSTRRQAFTVYGDTVNMASRLENMGKELDAAILLDETTANQIGPGFDLHDFGARAIRGFDENRKIISINTEQY